VRRLLEIGHLDIRLFLRRKGSYVWLFVVPLAFVYFMGLAVRTTGDPSDRKAPVLIENEDTNYLSRIFLDELGAQGLWVIDPTNRDTAARGIRIPAQFTLDVERFEPVKVEFFTRKESAEGDAALIELRLVRALIAMNAHLVEAAGTEAGQGSNAVPGEAALRRVMAAPDPVHLETRFAGRRPVPSGFNFSLPGNLVMYLMMNLLIFGGISVAMERRRGVIRRLRVHPVTRGALVMGKVYGLMLLGVVQIVVFLVIGRFGFGVNLGANLVGVGITLILFAWVAASLGVFVGSVFSSEDRVTGVCVLASLLMAALGGCWWPLEIGPPALQTLALCLPSGWALKALHQLISFGSGIGAVLVPWLVLGGFGIVANGLAMRFFRD
jgi:ABC-2 type transport system permease protein